MKKIIYLKLSDIFKNLNTDALNKIANISILKQCSKNEMICHANQTAHGLYIVGNGKLKVFKTSNTGQSFIFKIATAGDAIGEVVFVLENVNYPGYVQALEDSELLYIPKNEMIDILKKNNDIAFNLLINYAKIIYNFTGQLSNLALVSVKERLLKYLYFKANEQNNNELNLDISKQTLAEILGTIPETLSRVLKNLEKENKIESLIITIMQLE